jgi:hypothetical protein
MRPGGYRAVHKPVQRADQTMLKEIAHVVTLGIVHPTWP